MRTLLHLPSALLFLALPHAPTHAANSSAPKRPNIVFVFSDDHAWQAVGAYGEDRALVDTPHIDRIAREGMRFDRCLVTNSICGPSRATVLTGTYSHVNGFYGNVVSRFDGSQETFPKLLRAAGYQTALVGKWHLVTDPTGFDHWHILPDQGAYYNPPMIENGRPTNHEGYVTDIITRLATEWMDKRDPDRPFLLMLQHKAPHREWEPPLRHLGTDEDRVYAEPPSLFDGYEDRGIAVRDQDMTIARTMGERDLKLVAPANLTPEQRAAWDAYYEPRNAAFRQARLTGRDLVRWKYHRYLHDYLACVRAVDDSVGLVLEYLADHGLAEDTIVVYSSDQGFFLGEHGWFDKRWIFEESLRTPLVVRWPDVIEPGSVSRAIVSNLDFAQTFLEAAGLPAPARMQGRSLLPIFRGETPNDWRTSFYYHYYEYPLYHRVRPHYGVVTDRYKLAQFYGTGEDYTILMDLEADPLEMRSFADDPAYASVREELEQELARLRRELGVPATDPPEAHQQPLLPPTTTAGTPSSPRQPSDPAPGDA
jgi:arylsulfatase A-like enzyme